MQEKEIQKCIEDVLTEYSLPLYGFCDFAAIQQNLLPCRALQRMEEIFSCRSAPQTVILVLFPYRREEEPSISNLSRYARVPDYHDVAGQVLCQAAKRLEETFSGHVFMPFMDNSPIPEVKAAALAGLGCIGDHGLLIHPVYGSWVFIGSMVTDLSVGSIPSKISECLHCGQCARNCPGECLGDQNTRSTCISFLTQKKKELSPQEQILLRKSGSVWGCDRCQEVCPLNREAKRDPHPCFEGEYVPSLTRDSVDYLEGKAYGWRGKQVLIRNLSIIDDDDSLGYNK